MDEGEIWKKTFGNIPFKVSDKQSTETRAAQLCLREINRRKEDFYGVTTKAMKIHLILNDEPLGDIVKVLLEHNENIPDKEDLINIMAYLAEHINGRLLHDKDEIRWLVVAI
jgi:hypothetical protein